MPIRGESVGTAYIRLIADGTGIPDDIRDSIDDATKSFHDPGSVAAKEFKRGWEEELNRHDDKALTEAFNRALVNDEATGRFFQTQEWKNVERNFRAKFGSLGQAAADDMKTEFLRRGSLQGIEDAVENVATRVNQIFDDAVAENTRRTRQMSSDMKKLEDDFRKTIEETDRLQRHAADVSETEGARTQRAWERIGDSLHRARTEFLKGNGVLDDNGRILTRNRSAYSRFAVTVDHVAESVGRAFGKGSRSELLNFIGSFVTNATKLIGLPARLIGNISEFTSGFKEARIAGEGLFTSLKAGFTTAASDAEGAQTALSALVSSGVAAIPLLIVALVGIVSVLGIISSLITNIIAALLAFASTLSFGLVGVLTPLLGLIGPIGLGIGTIVLGIATLDDKSKKALKNAIKPLTDGLKDLGETAREGFLQTFNRGVDDMADKIRFLHPLVESIGEAFGNIGNQIVDAFDSPIWHRFVNQMTKFVPDALESLATSAGNLTGAFIEIFTDSIPQTRRFLGWLERITGEFQDFITSNPQKVKDFLEDAADSAETLGDFLGAAAKVLGDLLFSSSGKKEGDSLFDSLTTNLEKFDKFLDDHPDALGEFFKNGGKTARQIGELVLHISDLFDEVNNEQSQKNLEAVFTILNNISKLAPVLAFLSNPAFFGALGNLSVIGEGVDKVRELGRAVDKFKEKFTLKPGFAHGLISWIPGAAGAIGDFVRRVARQIHTFISNFQLRPGFAHGLIAWIPGAVSAIGGFVTRMGGAFGRASANAITTMHRMGVNVIQDITRIPGQLGNLAAQFGHQAARWADAVFRAIQGLPQQIVGLFVGLGHAIAEAIGSISIPVHFDVPEGARPFLGLAGRFLTASGGLFDRAQWRVIGEAGPEAVVPLTGPLSEVDPSVRWLAALARGGPGSQGVPATGPSSSGKTINVEQHITTPITDVRAVARETVNQLVAVGY